MYSKPRGRAVLCRGPGSDNGLGFRFEQSEPMVITVLQTLQVSSGRGKSYPAHKSKSFQTSLALSSSEKGGVSPVLVHRRN